MVYSPCFSNLFKINSENGLVAEKSKKPKSDKSVKKVKKDDFLQQNKINETLREKEGLFRELIETTNNLVTQVDNKGHYTYVNRISESILGLNMEECIGKSSQEFIHPEDRQRVERFFMERILSRKNNFTLECRMMNQATGKAHDMFWIINSHFDDNGELKYVNSFGHDLTERKEAEVALIHSEERNRLLIRNSSDVIIIFEVDGVLRYVSPSVEPLFGYNPEEVTGDNILDYLHPEDHQSTLDAFAKCISNPDELVYHVCRLRHKNGSWRVVETIGNNFLDHPALHAILANTRDITYRIQTEEELRKHRDHLGVLVEERTEELKKINERFEQEILERKQAEAILRESEERLRALFEGSLDAIFLTDPETGIILDANPIASQLFQISHEELIGLHHSNLYPPKFRENSNKAFVKFVQDNEEYVSPIEMIIQRSDEKIIFVEALAQIIQINGLPVLHSIYRDITERKQMENELLKIEKLESLGVLAGSIAHDYNNLLTGILTNVSVVKGDQALNGNILEILNDVEKAAFRAKGLTQQLLTFARGGTPIRKNIAITNLIHNTAVFALRGSNVKCDFKIAEDLWPVFVDEDQISQVINNLIINADQAMPDGGIINLQAENITLGPASENVFKLKKGQYVKISIKDRGTGISSEHITKIFDPFFTTKQKGSGLGLSTSYSIIKKHEGHIFVESELGAGTTFEIYLAASKKRIQEKKKPADKPRIGEGRILIMDDEEIVINALGRALKKIGYEVATAKDGQEAIALYKEAEKTGRSFDVVIMDLTIPGGMGGKESIKRLLKINPEIKAIVSSGYSQDPVISNYKKYGFSGVLSKPYRMEEISEILEKVMS